MNIIGVILYILGLTLGIIGFIETGLLMIIIGWVIGLVGIILILVYARNNDEGIWKYLK